MYKLTKRINSKLYRVDENLSRKQVLLRLQNFKTLHQDIGDAVGFYERNGVLTLVAEGKYSTYRYVAEAA